MALLIELSCGIKCLSVIFYVRVCADSISLWLYDHCCAYYVCIELQISLGVVLAIPPFNYPVNLAVSKIAHALIVGNSIVLKPPTPQVLCPMNKIMSYIASCS